MATSPAVGQAETHRLEVQTRLDSRFTTTERNRLGQFATPPRLAQDILRLARQAFHKTEKVRFLDPGLGTGAFFSALIAEFPQEHIDTAIGLESDEVVAAAARELWHSFGLNVRHEDFTRASESLDFTPRFNLVVCNPPYVRHHHLSASEKARLRKASISVSDVDPGGLAGLYCYFMLLAHAWMEEGGFGVWLVPSEFLDVNYGQALRRYLTHKVNLIRIHRFSPQDVQFSDALVTSSVVLFQKRAPRDHDLVSLTEGSSLHAPASSNNIDVAALRSARKWGALFGQRIGRSHYHVESVSSTVGDLFDIRRGIATGANRFFLLEPTQALESLALKHDYLIPILPSPRYLSSTVIEPDANGWPKIANQRLLLHCDLPRRAICERYPELDKYLQQGETDGLNRRYLLRGRNPWYRQELRPPAPILCTYMGRQDSTNGPFRFIRNYSAATATNVYLMLYPRKWPHLHGDEGEVLLDRIFNLLKSIPLDSLIGEGRSYGGGLRKLEPMELATVPLPVQPEELKRMVPFAQMSLL